MDCRVGYISICGPRSENEDSGLALKAAVHDSEFVLLGVCDGMGGDENGQRAATECTHILSGFPALVDPLVWKQTEEEQRGHIESAIRRTHQQMVQRLVQIVQGESLPGLTTTLAACFLYKGTLVAWWLGDSRVYRLRDGRLDLLTQDHSKVVELGIPQDEALEHPEKNLVSKFVRPGVAWEPEVRFSDWKDGDVVFVVSDGVSGSCRPWELETIFNYLSAADIDPTELARRVLKHVESNIGDNATMALAIRGTPKPFSSDAATLEWSTFTTYGVRQEIVQKLVEYPESSEEFESRDIPNCRQALPPLDSASAAEHRVRQPMLRTEAELEGKYMIIVDALGNSKPLSLDIPAKITFGRSKEEGADMELKQDEFVSPQHLMIQVNKDGQLIIEDFASDNGVWLYTGKPEVYRGTFQDGLSLSVGRHRLVFREGGAGSRALPGEPSRVDSGACPEAPSPVSSDTLDTGETLSELPASEIQDSDLSAEAVEVESSATRD